MERPHPLRTHKKSRAKSESQRAFAYDTAIGGYARVFLYPNDKKSPYADGPGGERSRGYAEVAGGQPDVPPGIGDRLDGVSRRVCAPLLPGEAGAACCT